VAYTHRNRPFPGGRVASGALGRLTGRLRTLFKDFF
jgi:hypothetical protein